MAGVERSGEPRVTAGQGLCQDEPGVLTVDGGSHKNLPTNSVNLDGYME